MKVETIKRFVRDWDREILVNKYIPFHKEPIKQNRSIIKVFVYADEETNRILFENYKDDIFEEDEEREKEIRNQLEILDDGFLLKCLEYLIDHSSYDSDTIYTLVFTYCEVYKKDYDAFKSFIYCFDSFDQIVIDI